MKKLRLGFLVEHPFGPPILILIIAILSYGIMVPWLRFYHDEYPIIWFQSIMGDVNIFFEGNRPLLARVYKPLLYIFDSKAWLWQVFGIFTRWCHAFIFYKLIRQIWPKESTLAIMSSLLILVFPGFQTQFASIIYGIAFLLYAMFLLSILFSVLAIKNDDKRNIFILISLLFSTINLLTSEYFYTLEMIRYLIIFILLKQKNKRVKALLLIRKTLPYLSLFGFISLFRIFIQAQETSYPIVLFKRIITDPIHQTILFFSEQLVDIWNVTIKSWLVAVNPTHLIVEQSARMQLLFFLVAFISALFIALTLFDVVSKNKKDGNNFEFMLVGFSALYFAGWPLWIAGLPIGEFFSYSRWTIPFMMGASMFIAGALSLIRRLWGLQLIIFSLLIGFGVRNQLMVSNSFRHDWQELQQFFWQLKWRMPSLQEDTVLFSDMLPFNYENSDQLSAGINLMLYPAKHADKLPYFLFFIPERINTSILPEVRKGIPINGKRYYRSFHGNTSQAIVIDFQYPSCLKILDPVIDRYNPMISPIIKDSLFLSNEELIFKEPVASVDMDIFGEEPAHEWCYFFQKAELARQYKEWDELESIYREATSMGYQPRDNREWLPFIKGLIHLGNYNEALKISVSIVEQSIDYKEMVCQVWKDAPQMNLSNNLSDQLKEKFDCRL